MKALINIPGAPKPVGPYSQAVVCGQGEKLLFTAGQIGLVPETGQIIQGGVAAQARQVMENLKAVLAGSGSGFDKVLMTTIFLADIDYSKEVSPIYAEYINAGAPPARQTLAVKELPLGALVEISLVAVCS